MKYGLLFLVLFADPVLAEKFNRTNNPSNFAGIAGTAIINQFDSLPLTGNLNDPRLGWSESYWPSNRGGIAYRWNHPDPQPFKYRILAKNDVLKMSEEELGQLSPAELYDIANDDYKFTLTRKTLRKFSPKDLWWEGICHGWAQAASHYLEPAPVVVTNKDGVKVPFGSSDVKALLSMHEAYNFGGRSAFVGARCKAAGKVVGEESSRDRVQIPPRGELAESPDCRDVNAGAFHVVITNMLGILGKGFVADIDRYSDVWNQPITGYTAKFVQELPVFNNPESVGVAYRVQMELDMVYGEELKFYTPELEAEGHKNFVSKYPVTRTWSQMFLSKKYSYILELDANRNIVGGEWLTETRPDFLWMFEKSAQFRNSPMPLANLKNIYKPVNL